MNEKAKKPEPVRSDPTSTFDKIADMVTAAGGIGNMLGELKAASRRSEAMNIKLTMLLELGGVKDWRADRRYIAAQARWKAEDEEEAEGK